MRITSIRRAARCVGKGDNVAARNRHHAAQPRSLPTTTRSGSTASPPQLDPPRWETHQLWVFARITASQHARTLEAQHRTEGDNHDRDLRARGDRLAGIFHGCLGRRTPDDETHRSGTPAQPYRLTATTRGICRRPHLVGLRYSSTDPAPRILCPPPNEVPTATCWSEAASSYPGAHGIGVSVPPLRDRIGSHHVYVCGDRAAPETLLGPWSPSSR